MAASTTLEPHSRPTRFFHALLAVAIIVQLASSQFMEPPAPDNIGNWYFSVHQYSGLFAFTVLLVSWINIVVRKTGTQWGALVPWFSGKRLSSLWHDIGRYWSALKSKQMPEHMEHSPFPSAIHGLGLLLMSAMAITGTLYYFVNQGDPDAGGLVGVLMFIHTSLGNLVWAYLIGHAALAVLQHFSGNNSLATMWSFKRNTKTERNSNEPQR